MLIFVYLHHVFKGSNMFRHVSSTLEMKEAQETYGHEAWWNPVPSGFWWRRPSAPFGSIRHHLLGNLRVKSRYRGTDLADFSRPYITQKKHVLRGHYVSSCQNRPIKWWALRLVVIIYNINQHYTIGIMIMLCKSNNYTVGDKLPTKYGAASSSILHEGTPVVCLREFHGACPQVSPRFTFVGIWWYMFSLFHPIGFN